MVSLLDQCLRARNANVALVAGLALPLIVGAGAAGIDFAQSVNARASLQAAADGAAIAAARELSLQTTRDTTVSAIVERHVRADLGDMRVTIESRVLDGRTGVEVNLTGEVTSVLGQLFIKAYSPHARAVARLAGGTPICVIGLEETEARTISLEKDARITATGCAVISNSDNPAGLMAKDNSVLRAGMTCSAGGFEGSRGNYAPEPVTDCPISDDPLAGRPLPKPGACTTTNAKVDDQLNATLSPGVFCGGLEIKNSNVTLSPGVYVIKDGELKVDDDSALFGAGVAFYFVGKKSSFILEPGSMIDLSAPESGPLAGFLLVDDRNFDASRRYRIRSNDAGNLLGTIYLSGGILEIEADEPIAQESAYTVVVANRIEVSGGPELVLNTDYTATSVPVPEGVGPQNKRPVLSE